MIKKWPVVIISNYRTGSSELALRLASAQSAVPLIEPVHHVEILKKLESMYSNGDMKFVVKYHIDQIDQLEIQKKLLEIDSYKIKITRNDKVSQITSYYISSVRNIWKQHFKDIESYEIPIDIQKINQSIEVILKNDRLLENSNIHFDQICCYEELDFSSGIQHNYKTTPPTNINLLKSIIKAKISI